MTSDPSPDERQQERQLATTLVRFDVVDPTHRDARSCLDRYFAELDRRFDDGFDDSLSLTADLGLFRPPGGTFVVARLRGEPVACGGLRFHVGEPAELKRMWVADSVRGLGVGRRLLAELEARAVAGGYHRVRLETNGALAEAIALYRSSGYREIPPYNDERYAHHWFEKDVVAGAT